MKICDQRFLSVLPDVRLEFYMMGWDFQDHTLEIGNHSIITISGRMSEGPDEVHRIAEKQDVRVYASNATGNKRRKRITRLLDKELSKTSCKSLVLFIDEYIWIWCYNGKKIHTINGYIPAIEFPQGEKIKPGDSTRKMKEYFSGNMLFVNVAARRKNEL